MTAAIDPATARRRSPRAPHRPPRTAGRAATSSCTPGSSCASPACCCRPGLRPPVRQPHARRGHPAIDFAFVAGKWASPFWQVWDLLMLWLAELHGANGVRTIINDYAEQDATRLSLKTLLVRRAPSLVIVLGTLVIFTFDPCIDPASTLSQCRRSDAGKVLTTMQIHKYDVVIVGAGGAGMRAALEAGQRARTAVLTKLYPTRSHTGAAQGGMCAALANVEEDNWEWHTFDTVKGGDYLVDQDAAEIMAKEAIDAVLDLEKMGLPFNRTPEGKIDQRRFGGHTRNHGEAAGPPRLLRRRPHRPHDPADAVPELRQAGRRVLQRVLRARPAHDARPHGVERSRRRRRLRAGHRRDPRLPGQGRHLRHRRLRQGLQDHLQRPHPHRRRHGRRRGARACRWRTWSSSSSTRPASPASASCSPRPPAARAASCATPTASASWSATRPPSRTSRRATSSPASMANEVREGRGAGPEQGLRAASTCTHLAAGAASTPSCRTSPSSPAPTSASSPYTEPVPVIPTAHYAMGGIPTNVEAEVLRDNTDVVPACTPPARCACVSVHGSNRLGTNSLLDINVFGRRAGIAAAEYAADRRLRRRCPRTRSAHVVDDDRGASATPTAPSGSPRSARSCRRPWTATRRCSAPRSRSKQALERHRRAASERYRERRRPGQGQAVQHRPARGGRARLPARPRRGARRVAPWPARSPAAATSARTTHARRRQLHAAHDGLPARTPRRRHRVRSGSTTSRSS